MSHDPSINTDSKANTKEAAARLVETAKAAGAVDADAMAVSDRGEHVSVRNGQIETIEHEDSRGIGLRAFVETARGRAFASASSSDISDHGINRLVEQVITMANISEPDPDCVSPSGADHPSEAEIAEWNSNHPSDDAWTLNAAREAALTCEEAGLSHSNLIENSEGAEAGFGSTHVAYACADGFAADYQKASLGLSISLIAGRGDGMQRDYAYSRVQQPARLRSPVEIGQEAAERALRRLGAESISTRSTTVVFEPRIATSILGHLAGSINGRAVLQKRSFMADSCGELIFPESILIIDDPDHPDGLGNRLFDGEGTRCCKRTIIDQGRLTGFLTDRYAAGRLKTEATGNARRGLVGDTSIGTSNFILTPGEQDFDTLIKEIGDGLLVTELMGMGVNGVTGDYSRGAGGFLIENGEVARPVTEITIAGNLKEMFANVSHIGSDLTWFGSTAVPTIAISDMTIAGV